MKSPFQLSVITDEISQDFGRACEVAAREFGLEWVELRELWHKNLFHLDATEIEEARRVLERYELRVVALATPLFKVDWPGAPRSRFSPPRDEFKAGFSFEQQPLVLARAIELARLLGASRLRCFDFWRLDDARPYRAEMNQHLLEAALTAGANGLVLVLENEFACNTATGAEAAEVLESLPTPGLMLAWDPANAVVAGEAGYPEGYRRLPKARIGHCHCKDVRPAVAGEAGDAGPYTWTPVGEGVVGWTGQFRALLSDGYRGAVSLESHWRGAASKEEASRRCFQGMRAALRRSGAEV